MKKYYVVVRKMDFLGAIGRKIKSLHELPIYKDEYS